MMGYLTGNQCHIPYRMFVLHRNLVDNKWMGKIYNQSEEYQVYSNPKIVTSSTEKIEAVE